MDVKTICNFACCATHTRIHPREIDRNFRVFYRSGVEKRVHQFESIKFTIVTRSCIVLKCIPNGANATNVIRHSRRRMIKMRRKSTFNMGAHLRAESEMEAPI